MKKIKFKISQEAKSARVIQVIETVTLAGDGTSGVVVNIIEKMLTAREILLGRHYLPGSIKHYELVEG